MSDAPSRRNVLTAIASTVVVSGAGPLKAVAPVDEPGLAFVYEAIATLKPTVEIGTTSRGIRRRIDITGGQFAGPRIRGTILPGGADWQLQRGDGWTEIEADYMMQADDGTLIHVRNVGLTHSRVTGVVHRYLRTVPSFEVPVGPHDWLNKGIFVGTLGPPPEDTPMPAVRIRVYRVT
ncbi:MAG: DUF3237 domain-containing protein [Sphingobium sp.]